MLKGEFHFTVSEANDFIRGQRRDFMKKIGFSFYAEKAKLWNGENRNLCFNKKFDTTKNKTGII